MKTLREFAGELIVASEQEGDYPVIFVNWGEDSVLPDDDAEYAESPGVPELIQMGDLRACLRKDKIDGFSALSDADYVWALNY